MLFRFTSYVSQLSVEKAMASNATATMADIVASDNVTAEHGIFLCVYFVFRRLCRSTTFFVLFLCFFFQFTVFIFELKFFLFNSS